MRCCYATVQKTKVGGSAAERGEDPVSGDRRSDPGGDTVTISGMPDTVCNAVAKGLNGEVMIQTMDGDEMVAVLTRARTATGITEAGL